MRTLIATCLLVATLASAHADEVADLSAADRQAIQGVISGQLEAFQGDQDTRAFGYASPHIQSMFGNSAHFMAMVRQGYPPVYRPRGVEFGPLASEDGRIVQHVELVGPDGSGALALYTMERESDGTWRIDGCALTKSERVGV